MFDVSKTGKYARKIIIDGAGCWAWQGYVTPKGYGRISQDYRPKQAHRVIYELLVGPIPAGLTLDHLCRNRSCVNPQHLEPVTNRENLLRGIGPSARNARATHCPSGHPYSPSNTARRQGYRRCKQCDKEYQSARYAEPQFRQQKVAASRAYRAREG